MSIHQPNEHGVFNDPQAVLKVTGKKWLALLMAANGFEGWYPSWKYEIHGQNGQAGGSLPSTKSTPFPTRILALRSAREDLISRIESITNQPKKLIADMAGAIKGMNLYQGDESEDLEAEVAALKNPPLDLDFITDRDQRIAISGFTQTFISEMRDGAGALFRAGAVLKEIRERLEHGQWLTWLERFFCGSERSAQRLLLLHENLNATRVSDLKTPLPAGVLYFLASPSTPEEAKEEILAQAESGEKVTLDTAKAIKEKHSPKPKRERKPKEPTEPSEPTGWDDDAGEEHPPVIPAEAPDYTHIDRRPCDLGLKQFEVWYPDYPDATIELIGLRRAFLQMTEHFMPRLVEQGWLPLQVWSEIRTLLREIEENCKGKKYRAEYKNEQD